MTVGWLFYCTLRAHHIDRLGAGGRTSPQLYARIQRLSAAEDAAMAFSLLYRVSALEREQDASAIFSAGIAKRRAAYGRHLGALVGPAVVRLGTPLAVRRPAQVQLAAAPSAPASVPEAVSAAAPPASSDEAITPAPAVAAEVSGAPVVAPELLQALSRRRGRRTVVVPRAIVAGSPHSPPRESGGGAGHQHVPTPIRPLVGEALPASDVLATQEAEDAAALAPSAGRDEPDPLPVVVATDSASEALRRAQTVARAMKFSNDLVHQQVGARHRHTPDVVMALAHAKPGRGGDGREARDGGSDLAAQAKLRQVPP